MKVGGTCPAFPFLPVLLFTVSPPGVLPRNPTSEAVGCRVLLRATWERTAPRSLRARHPSQSVIRKETSSLLPAQGFAAEAIYSQARVCAR